MDIREKIKALLAKAASSTSEHESSAFAAKAYELMEREQLSVHDLDTEDKVGQHEYIKHRGAAPDWPWKVAGATARYFGCMTMTLQQRVTRSSTEYRMMCIGRESARITAEEMYKYFVATIKRLGKEKAAEMGVSPDKAARLIGNSFAIRLNTLRLAAKREESATVEGKNALVTLDAVKAFAAIAYPDATPARGGKVTTSEAARSVAGGISLAGQVGAGGSRLAIGGK